jgi:hypothetical protein
MLGGVDKLIVLERLAGLLIHVSDIPFAGCGEFHTEAIFRRETLVYQSTSACRLYHGQTMTIYFLFAKSSLAVGNSFSV